MNASKARKLMLALAASLLLATLPAAAQNDGASAYKSKCAGCHAADGSGNSPAGKAMHLRDLGSADVQKQSDADLNTIVANGKGTMPGYKGKLTDDQIKQVVAFVRTFAKKG
ncbi:MAG TPA: cytochrome c [Candidatus Baltobacteraceae bacterium]|nr:cytochrome c [Candidatus Baltobacteraceae bacterium]